jgi:hypothetical protein
MGAQRPEGWHGWCVYAQKLTNQRHREPSIVLARADRVILAYLRTTSRNNQPGLEYYVWRPADWPSIRSELIEPA